MLTSTSRSLVPPAPHPIGQALNVRGANAMIPGIASEDDFSSILIVGTINDSPLAMVQREGAETGTHVDYEIKKKERKAKKEVVQLGADIVYFGLFRLTDFISFSHFSRAQC